MGYPLNPFVHPSQALLKGGADINAKMTGGITILHLMVGLLLGLNREVRPKTCRHARRREIFTS